MRVLPQLHPSPFAWLFPASFFSSEIHSEKYCGKIPQRYVRVTGNIYTKKKKQEKRHREKLHRCQLSAREPRIASPAGLRAHQTRRQFPVPSNLSKGRIMVAVGGSWARILFVAVSRPGVPGYDAVNLYVANGDDRYQSRIYKKKLRFFSSNLKLR